MVIADFIPTYISQLEVTMQQFKVFALTAFVSANFAAADDALTKAFLKDYPATAYLFEDGIHIEKVQPESYDPAGTVAYQKYIDEVPVHGSRVLVINDEDDFPTYVFDESFEDLGLDRSYPSIDEKFARAIAESHTDLFIDSSAELIWFQRDEKASLCWKITTTLEESDLPISPTHMESIVDGHTGEILSQRQIDTNNYYTNTQQNMSGVFPRIVVNNAMGVAGGRSYGAAFDAVVYVGGCTGTLIAPNVVLSARHCGIGPGTQVVFGDNLNNNGSLFFANVQSSFLPDGGGSLLDGGDVAILTLTSSIPTSVAEPMRLIDETNNLLDMQCATVGYGLNGLGSNGHNFSDDGYRWGGENIIDRYGSPASGGGGSNIISTDFDNGTGNANTIGGSSSTPVQYEATTAPGDSGGPVLVQLAGEWVIAGVLSGGTTSFSTYGDISWWTGTAVYRNDIESRGGEFGIPAPGACCFSNGTCTSVFNEDCESAGGSFEGGNTSCNPSPCPGPTVGACCFGSANCSELTPNGCSVAGGTFLGLGSGCDDNGCAPRACCLASGTCLFVSPETCNAVGGSSDAIDCASSSCAPPPCPEDLNDNGMVDFADILEMLGAWGVCGSCDEDIDNNGLVDFNDLLILLSKWGPC
ncbi:MAG: hypothetical protein CMJ28_05200 [Phycisphaerae bacterium]|nr:hypothetical protein [Phycisphaerae bacterium]